MLDRALITIGVNGVFLLIASILLLLIIRASVQFNWNYGDGDKQIPIRNTFLKLLVSLVMLGFFAAIANIIISWI
ncbi:MAG: hypothetical protein HYR90_00230 [Candidatus Andersenbacteria bacterium]|nr:hypothetical protein [Candidatus Andersenbacteria bacterium]MBI3250666.1 hypothetical protein [Candidatus Andersenbacteria bacterium]